jgi:hypothetical protein
MGKCVFIYYFFFIHRTFRISESTASNDSIIALGEMWKKIGLCQICDRLISPAFAWRD